MTRDDQARPFFVTVERQPMTPKSISLVSMLLLLLYSPAIFAGQPNVIVLLADDLGYGELGCQGNAQIPTPHIDSIAKQGARFTQAYVTAPNCSPSRAGLLTGRIPTRFGYEFNPIGARNEDHRTGLPRSEITIAEALHNVGYTTGLIGKWHQGGAADFHPHRHGFDEFFGFTHEGHYFVPPPYKGVTTMLRRKRLPENKQGRWIAKNLIYTTHMGHDEPDYDANNPIIRGGQPVEEKSYLTNAYTREAVDFIDRHQDKPFFLMLSYNAVHSPLQAADQYMEKFGHIEDIHRRIFAAMLANLDDCVGAVLKKVDDAGLNEKTLVIFLSDNGGPTRELTSSNAPLRGEKGQMYDGGLRVPFMMRFEGKIKSGTEIQFPISSMDIFATAADLAGAEINHEIDGKNLLPYLGRTSPAELIDEPHPTFFWRQGNKSALRDGNWKIVKMSHKESAWQLYNLSEDIAESKNLAAEQPEKLNELIDKWKQMNLQMKSPLFE